MLGANRKESPQDIDPATMMIRNSVKTAIGICDRNVFWKTECYTQALTAKILLRGYLIPSTVYIGFSKGVDGSIKGHAWLRSHDTILTGGKECESYIVQSYFC